MITAVIVTYNRVALLQECLQAVENQTLTPDKIIVIDNHSTDDTAKFLASKNNILSFTLEENIGGAGGFNFGMRKAYELGSESASKVSVLDYVWAMDDDTIPEPNALSELVNAGQLIGEYSFLASKVVGDNNAPMNVPSVSKRVTQNGYPYWYKYLHEGIVEISDATFVSLFFPRKSLEKCGLPFANFFIWGDDYEYTTRLTRHCGPAYFVGRSLVIHKRKGAKALDFLHNDDPWVEKMSCYFYRNMLINLSEYGDWTSVLKFLLYCTRAILHGKIRGPLKGIFGWLTGNYNRKQFKQRFKI